MTVTAHRPAATAEELLDELIDRYPDARVEMSAEGVVEITMTPPVGRHQQILTDLTFWLGDTLGSRRARRRIIQGLGVRPGSARRVPDLVVLREGTTVVDDLAYQDVAGVLLAVEVESKTTRSNDWGPKLREYAFAGIPHYWIVGSDEVVAMHTLSANGTYQLQRTVPLADLLDSTALPPGIVL